MRPTHYTLHILEGGFSRHQRRNQRDSAECNEVPGDRMDGAEVSQKTRRDHRSEAAADRSAPHMQKLQHPVDDSED